MANKKLSDIKHSLDQYDIKSKDRIKRNLERKFKKLFGYGLYLFETMLRPEIEKNPDLHKEFKSELFRAGNRIIQNMKAELDCYNVEYVPFTIELRMENERDE
jgi:hypothetical protein